MKVGSLINYLNHFGHDVEVAIIDGAMWLVHGGEKVIAHVETGVSKLDSGLSPYDHPYDGASPPAPDTEPEEPLAQVEGLRLQIASICKAHGMNAGEFIVNYHDETDPTA